MGRVDMAENVSKKPYVTERIEPVKIFVAWNCKK